VAALQVLDQFERRLESLRSGRPVRLPEENVCPRCKAVLETGQDECPICTRAIHTPPSTWTLLRLWRFAKPYRGQLLAGFLLTLATTAANMVPPYLSMPIMDKVLIPYQNGAPIDARLVATYLGGLLAAALVGWGLGWARTYILALVSERIGADLRTTTYEHLLRLSLEYFGGKRTGDLMSRIGSESDRICVFLSLHLLDFANDVLMIVMTAIILFAINPWLAAVTFLPLPVIVWMIHVVRDRLRTGFEKIDRVWSEVTSILADTIPGIRVVKAFAQEEREALRFREANRRNLAVNDRLNRTWSLFAPTVSLLTEVGLLVVWAFGIWQVSKSEITVGVLTAFLAYIGRFYTRLDSMSRIVSVTQKAASGAKRIFDILDHVSSVPEPTNPVHLSRVQGSIALRGISFRYGNRSVVRNLDLDIRPGEMIGLVGHSGSGKSTLVNLICRFYDVSEGAIHIDGVDIRAVPVAEYRRNIGLVLQEPFLFFGTIADNIAYGRPGASRAEIVAAARAANAHEFILRLPHGYDSLVGERGQGLSGGERQRISIARALLIDPRILILDEATSSVDTETEKEIQNALDNLVSGRTTIAIAHRLSTLRQADRLVVMDRGQIVEIGTHDDLMAREGAYHRLYQAQARNVDTDIDDLVPDLAPEMGATNADA
ncbi:MAG: ABC transporter ATP-binding protein, partial [Rhodocyclaceae bacterium]|nr:ABC transporter ATP-binding protein [Rhodocyclaceae bacterium]